MKTRAELIEGLTRLQMERRGDDEKEYFRYHNRVCKLTTRNIKQYILQEVYWKLRKEQRDKEWLLRVSKAFSKVYNIGEQNGTTTKI